MRTKLFILTAVAAMLLGVQATADVTKLVYRVDSATAVIVKQHLIISANGAVRSGGWDRPRLLVLQPSAPEARTLEVQFVARPPAPKDVVVQSLLPVAARKVATLPSYGTVQVKIISETNSIVVQVTH